MREATPLLAALALLSLTPLCSAQAQLVGDWSGSLVVGGRDAHIIWHVVKASDVSVASTFDNVDEGILGIKVKALTVKGDDITVVIDDVIHPNGQDLPLVGTFVGKLGKDGNQVASTWTQTQPQPE